MVVAHALHLIGIGIEHTIVVGLAIFCEDLMKLFRRLIAVGGTCLFSHVDTAIRHESSLQRLIGLQAYDLLQVLHALVNITGSIGCHTGNNIRLHVEHTALGALLFLQFLQTAP